MSEDYIPKHSSDMLMLSPDIKNVGDEFMGNCDNHLHYD